MRQMIIDEITHYVQENIASFHTRRIHSLDNLKLKKILERKNPYLFKAKYVLTAEQIIKGLVDAHISSNEETIFGDWLEGLAIFINGKIFGGKKSSAEGIDLEFDNNNVRYIVSIKSGPNWGNSGQINKMISNFNTARKILRTGNAQLNVIAVNGCCYGRDNHPDKNGIYFKYCGQKFWEFISGDPTLYTKIIKPLGHHAREKNESFMQSYAQMVNKFTFQFTQEFCNESGAIDWEKLIKFNSSAL